MIDVLIQRGVFVLIAVLGLSAAGQFMYLELGLPEHLSSNTYWLIYLFLVPVTLIGYFLVAKKIAKDPKSGGKNAMILTSVKMVAALIFLSPWIINKTEYSEPFAMQFMTLYFILLTTETILFVKLINDSLKKNEK